jgi:hypothetical protein
MPRNSLQNMKVQNILSALKSAYLKNSVVPIFDDEHCISININFHCVWSELLIYLKKILKLIRLAFKRSCVFSKNDSIKKKKESFEKSLLHITDIHRSSSMRASLYSLVNLWAAHSRTRRFDEQIMLAFEVLWIRCAWTTCCTSPAFAYAWRLPTLDLRFWHSARACIR